MPTDDNKFHSNRLPILALSLSSLFWSGNFIVGRALRDEMQALTLNYWRWLIALLIILPFSITQTRTHAQAIKRHWFFLGVLSVTGIVGFHLCVYQALHTTTAINALLFLSISPLIIIVASRIAYKDKINIWQIVGIFISLIGVLVLLNRGDLARLRSLVFNIGDLWMLGAVLLWSVYSVVLKRKPAPLTQLALLNSSMAIGVIIMTPFYLISITGNIGFAITLANLSGLMYISLFASLVAYFCWNYGVSQLGPNSAGGFLHLMPLFGAILSVLLLDEGIHVYHLIGAAFIATGLTLSNRSKAKSP